MIENVVHTDGGEPPVLCLENLTKRYGSFTALDDLSLTLNAGQILGLIGPNGAGKTTTIKILVGLIKPTSGKASISGVDCLSDSRQIKRLVGYMPDKFGSYDNMRVREYLDFFGAAFDMRVKSRAARIDHVMELTGITYMKDRYVESLSHGMQQRVGLARTLLHDPKFLILDETDSGLDIDALRIVSQGVNQLITPDNAVILVTHYQRLLNYIVPDFVHVMEAGRIIKTGDKALAVELEKRGYDWVSA